MKKSYLVMAAAAALFAACSSNDLAEEKQRPQTQDAAVEQAVEFGAYVNRGTTRAGWAGELTTSTGDNNLQTEGFGVFGYYTNNELYSESSKPNFMYNQKVSGSSWTYSPIKYWPNEYGSAAISDAQDKLTFFAYAPWVDVEPTTGLLRDQTGGKNNSGIVALTRNTASGDPFVKYFADMDPAKRVDLCWGVAAADFTSSVEGSLNDIQEGKPYKDVSKPKVNSKIKFDFNHALASLNVQIDADIDQDAHGDYALAPETKIFVRSVTFEGFASKGMFDLNAEKTAPKWYDLTGINELTNGKVTIYDGRRDGSEGQVNAAASNETPNDLNSAIIQSYSSSALSSTTGVPSSAAPVNLFNSTTVTEPVYVIPTGEPLKVTIVYDVETEDDNLAAYLSDGKTKGSSIENAITKSITISAGTGTVGDPLKLEAGKKYTVKLHLGMTSVKFEAAVSNWTDADTGEPWLPVNNGAALAAAISASETTFNFTFAGATGLITETAEKLNGVASTDITVSGTAPSGTLTLAAGNATVANKNYEVTVKDATPSTPKELIINLTQKAKAFVLKTPTIAIGNATIDVEADTGSGTVTDPQWAAAVVTVQKSTDGTNWTDAAFTYTGGTAKGTITLVTAPVAGQYYKISVKVGDADAATYTATSAL